MAESSYIYNKLLYIFRSSYSDFGTGLASASDPFFGVVVVPGEGHHIWVCVAADALLMG